MPEVTYKESIRKLIIEIQPTPRKILLFGFLIYVFLFSGGGLIYLFMTFKLLSKSIKQASFTLIVLPIGVILLLYSLQILKSLFEREIITLNSENLTITKNLFWLKKTKHFLVKEIRHLELNLNKEIPNHLLSNLPNDYLGFKIRDQENDILLANKGLKFLYNGYKVYFGKGLYLDDATEILSKLKNSTFSN